MRESRGGFTLIEILTIFAVIALLLGVALPRIAVTKRLYDVIGSADQFAADLRRARAAAQRLNTNVRFVVANADGDYQADYGSAADTVILAGRLRNGVRIDPGTATIRFTAFGPIILPTAGATSQSFQLFSSNTRREVTVSSSGEVRVR